MGIVSTESGTAAEQVAVASRSPAEAAAVPSAEIPVGSNADDEGIEIRSDDSSTLNSTASLTASIYEYRRIHGRTFQVSKTTEYWAPNDRQQTEAQDVAHHCFTLALGDKLFLAPIGDSPQRILDIGTGTGLWAIDMADQFPSAEVVGTDISPIQPSWVPQNCRFQIDDAQQDWTWPENHFDFIHTRSLEGCLDSWDKLYGRAFRHLKPGGWYEDVEFDCHSRSATRELPEDHIFNQGAKIFFEAGEKMGKTMRVAQDHAQKNRMEKAGFVNIVETRMKIPIGGWSSDPRLKQVGLYNALYLEQSLEGFGVFIFRELMGWADEEIETFQMETRKQLKDPKNTPYYELWLTYGQKPVEEKGGEK